MPPAAKTALVIGATSRIGQACITALLGLNYHVTYTAARKWTPPFPKEVQYRLTARKLNLENIEDFNIERWMDSFDLAILIPPIYLSRKIIPFAKTARVKRLVFISSYNTYRFGQSAAYAPLKAAEEAILSSELDVRIIQPTMIIGHAQSSASRIILSKTQHRKAFYGVRGRPARQQPIDFRDLAAALIHAGTQSAVNHGRYPVAGQNIVTSQELYSQIGQLIGSSPKFMSLPAFITTPMIKVMSQFLPKAGLTAYLLRLGQDRHCVHDTLPGWHPQLTLNDSLQNLRLELQAKA